MAHLLDLPEEVVESSILPHLSWNDLLRCRRVCKVIKNITNGFIRVNPELVPEIEISELSGKKSLKSFLAMDIPTTKLFLNNPSGHGFYDNLDATTLSKFVTTHAPTIKSLRVVQLSLYPCFNEWTFLQSLSTLKTFEAGFIGHGLVPSPYHLQEISERNYERAETDPRIDKQNILPRNFNNNLESIRIGNTYRFTEYSIGNIQNRMPIILRNCPKMNYISFPVNLHFPNELPFGTEAHFNEPYEVMGLMFIDYINSIVYHLVNKEKHLEYIDFENYHDNQGEQITAAHFNASPYFLLLCLQCTESGVKLLNVNPLWFSQRLLQQREPRLRGTDLGKAVVSLVNLDPCVFPLEMPNLEKIDIRKTSKSSVFRRDGLGFGGGGRADWPALKTLHINVDAEDAQRGPQHTYLLFSLFWRNSVRVNMTEFSLTFEVEDGVVRPFTEDIAAAFPNLKRLKIGGWPGENKALAKLWIGLPGLEEVTLENCKGLRNAAFVGEDSRSPAFLKLKKLKKLSLKGLDKMEKLTDKLFSNVLSKMRLTHLILTSDKPIEKITKTGICSLLETDQFSRTIERFPFTGWSLAGISAEEFKQLGLKFRSSQML